MPDFKKHSLVLLMLLQYSYFYTMSAVIVVKVIVPYYTDAICKARIQLIGMHQSLKDGQNIFTPPLTWDTPSRSQT